MNELNIALVAIGGIVLLIGLVSDLFRRTWWLSEPLAALLCGIVLSPVVLGLLHANRWGIKQEELLEQAARLTLAIGLMGVALRLPKHYAYRNWKPLAVLLVLVMPLMWGASKHWGSTKIQSMLHCSSRFFRYPQAKSRCAEVDEMVALVCSMNWCKTGEVSVCLQEIANSICGVESAMGL